MKDTEMTSPQFHGVANLCNTVGDCEYKQEDTNTDSMFPREA